MDVDLQDLSLEELSKLCRVCLKKENVVNIFLAYCNEMKLDTIYENVFQEQLIPEDETSKHICINCIDLLMKYHDFLQMHTKNRVTFQKVLNLKKLKEEEKPAVDPLADRSSESTLTAEESAPYLIDEDDDDFIPFQFEIPSKYSAKERRKAKEKIDDSEMACSLCDYSAPGEKTRSMKMQNIQRHYIIQHVIKVNNAGIECLKCKLKLRTKDDMKEHFHSNMHQEKTCNTCGKSFDTIKKHYYHVRKKKCNPPEQFTCLHCKEGLKSFEQVLQHYKKPNHLLSMRYSCLICGKVKTTKMNYHLLKHRPKKYKFCCMRCPMIFERKIQLDEHKAQVDHTKKLCEICNQYVPYAYYNTHLGKHASGHVCHICGQKFVRLVNLRKHIDAEHEGKRFYCEKCGKAYRHLDTLKLHMNVHHGSAKLRRTKYYRKCETCGITLYRYKKRRLKLHEAFHKFGHKVMCPLEICDLTFSDKDALSAHMLAEHERMQCDQCQKEFYDRKIFKVHSEIHIWENSDKTAAHTCRICHVSFDSFDSLAKHLRDIHSIYMCLKHKSCNMKLFDTNKSFYSHSVKKKIMARKVSCKICNREFRSMKKLSIHEEGHHKVRPFKCSICNYMFTTAGQLKVHLRFHTREKPYKCRMCDKTFAVVFTRQIHERIHTGEKPYQCEHCQHRFTDRSSYRSHLSSMHKQSNSSVKTEEIDIEENKLI